MRARLAGALGRIVGRPCLARQPLPHRGAAWDLVDLALGYEGVWIEPGDSASHPRVDNLIDRRSESQVIGYATSQRVELHGVEVALMPKADLARCKTMLGREVDPLDL